MVPISAGHPVRGPKWFLELDARYYYNQRRVVGGVVDYIKLGNKSWTLNNLDFKVLLHKFYTSKWSANLIN